MPVNRGVRLRNEGEALVVAEPEPEQQASDHVGVLRPDGTVRLADGRVIYVTVPNQLTTAPDMHLEFSTGPMRRRFRSRPELMYTTGDDY